MILLMIATHNELCKEEGNINTHMNLFQRLRYPIGLNGNKNYHHGTKGRSYGVGLVAKYRKDENGLSFGTYGEKLQRQEKVSSLCLDIENTSEQIHSSSHELYKIFDELMSASLKKPLEIIPYLHKNILSCYVCKRPVIFLYNIKIFILHHKSIQVYSCNKYARHVCGNDYRIQYSR